MATPIRVLILEDQPADAELMVHELRRAGFDPDWRLAATEAEYLAHLDPSLDVILADYTLPQFDAPQALQALQERGLDIPAIIVTGTIGEETAVECLRLGAADYLLKGRLARLGAAVTRAIEEYRVRAEERRLSREEEERRRQLEAVRAVTLEITRELDLATLLDLISRRAGELVGTRSGMIWLWDEAAQALIPRTWHGRGEMIKDVRLALGEGVTGTVAQRREGLIVNDYSASPYAVPRVHDRTHVAAVLAEPLLYRDRLLGVITLDDGGTAQRFTERDRETIALFAGEAAIAVENARLYDESQRQAREAMALADVGRALSDSLDMEHVLDQVVQGVRQVMNVPFVGILRLDEERQELSYIHGAGLSPERRARVRLKVREGIAGRAVAEGVPCQSPDLLEDPSFVNKAIAQGEGFRSVLCAPLLARGKPLGVLAVFREDVHEFLPAEVQLLARFADQAAVALENARIYGEVKSARDFLQSIAANSTDGIATTDLRGRLTYVSPGAQEIIGHRAEEIVGRRMADYYRGGIHEAWAVMRRLQAEGSIRNFETALRAKDGRWVDVSISMSLLRDAHGAMVGTLGITRDITERRRAEEDLRKLSRAVEQSPTSIVITDAEGRIEYVNPKFTVLTGYSFEEVRGQNPRILKSGETPPEEYKRLWETITAGREWHGEFRNKKKDGSLFWEAASISPVRNAEGRITHFIAIKEDTTDQKRIEEFLRQSEKLATMGELLAGVAHELNNPLSVVMGQANLLTMQAGEGPLAERARKIIDAAERCGRIVKNFLTLARQRPPKRQKVALNRLVQEAVEMLAYPLRVDTVAVSLDVTPDLPVLWVDPHQLQQVLVNLITNAHYAMRANPPPRRLALTTRFDPARQRVVLEVADTGPGIPAKTRSRLFEPFFTTKPPGEGTGLGLSLCQGIIEGHGGTIRVESQPGQGALFRVELPVETPPPAEAQTELAGALSPILGKTVLVVEDEPLIAELIAEVLALEGHQVELAANGAEALGRLQQHTYDLILSDLRMPDMDGPSLYREVSRRNPELGQRFIFVTGDLLRAESKAFIEQTKAPSLQKPFTPKELRQAVQQALRRR